MVQRAQAFANILQDLRIGLQGGACPVLRPRRDTGRDGDVSNAFKAGDGDFLVDGREQPVGADEGVGSGGGNVDGDVAAGGEGKDGGGEGEVISRIIGWHVREGAGEWDELEFGPVGRVGGEGGESGGAEFRAERTG